MLPLIGVPTADGLFFYVENLFLIGSYVFLASILAFGGGNPLLKSFCRWEPPIPPGAEFRKFRCAMRKLRMNQIQILGVIFCLLSVATHLTVGLHAAFAVPMIINGAVPWYLHTIYL